MHHRDGLSESWLLTEEHLAPYAMRSSQSAGRHYPEDSHDLRSSYQRDRDRIIHTVAFRQLEGKTQVFSAWRPYTYRTRLTHTIEVSALARTIARSLRLNEDLVEAITLAHDIGHPPFGHIGEHALDDFLRDHGGFEHNRQALRILTLLERRYPDFPGLNLTIEVLAGLDKPRWYDELGRPRQGKPGQLIEAQVVDVADTISYNAHDLDDALQAGLLNTQDLESTPLWRRAHSPAGENDDPAVTQHQAIRRIIDSQARDLIEATWRRIHDLDLSSIEDVERCQQPIVVFSDSGIREYRELRMLLRERVYAHPTIASSAGIARQTFRRIFAKFQSNPNLLPINIRRLVAEHGTDRAICDHIAGLTDQQALDEAAAG